MVVQSNIHQRMSYFVVPFTNLPDPSRVIPFHQQAGPISEPYQVHTQPMEMEQCTSYQPVNPLPYGHFVGRYHRQIFQPQYLGVNEQLRDKSGSLD